MGKCISKLKVSQPATKLPPKPIGVQDVDESEHPLKEEETPITKIEAAPTAPFEKSPEVKPCCLYFTCITIEKDNTSRLAKITKYLCRML